jgi:pseudouridine kinase
VDAVVADANLAEPALAALVQVRAPRCLLTVSPAKAPRLRGCLEGTWLLACAAPEAAVLSGLEVRSPQEALRAGSWLRGAGCERVVVTLGAQGLVWCGQEEVFVPSPQVTVADATGAGDAVAACAVFSLLAGFPDREAARLCAWAGALTVQVEGTTNPKLRFEVLRELAGADSPR